MRKDSSKEERKDSKQGRDLIVGKRTRSRKKKARSWNRLDTMAT